MGEEVVEFEQALANYLSVGNVISCANGTDALQMALRLFDINEKHVVFCPTFTFFATAEVIANIGATPIFVDSDIATFNICPIDLEAKINWAVKNTNLIPKAVIAVDLFGLPANFTRIQQICSVHGLKLIEDAAQGLGGKLHNQHAGSFGDIATTSFFPAKPLGCYGDGGAIMTNCDTSAEILRSLRVHGQGHDKYDNVRIGYNSRLDTIQAAVLLEKLAIFPEELIARNKIASFYSANIDPRIKIPTVPDGFISSWAQYTIRVKRREELRLSLSKLGIPSAIYYTKSMHKQTAFDYLGYYKDRFPVADLLSDSVISIPMHPYLSEIDQIKVINALNSHVGRFY